MNTRGYTIGAGIAVAIVVSVIAYLQGFDAEKIACSDIPTARTDLQAMYDAGVSASVQVFAEEKVDIDERLSICLNAEPIDPCADAQKARDTAVANFNGIPSPAEDAPYAEFQTYFKARDDAYNVYKTAKDTLSQCREANPPKPIVPYEKSDTKACFGIYDAEVEVARTTFEQNTRTMRTALKSAQTALDAREKACHPPTGKKKFTQIPGGGVSDGSVPENILSCKMVDADVDSELLALRKRAGAIPGEIGVLETSIENIHKRMSPLERNLRDVDTYIPPESAKTQYEGALNALRAERKVSIESSLEFYKNLLSRRQAEKATLEQELRDVNAKITARLAEIKKENDERQRKFPTALHQSKPDKCEYYHCHGMLCGLPDPDSSACGQGATTQEDVDCKLFLDSYLKEAGVN